MHAPFILSAATVLTLPLLALLVRRHAMRRAPARALETVTDPDLAPGAAPAAVAQEPAASIPFADATVESMTLVGLRRAFGVASFNYAVLGEHQAVMERVRRAIPHAALRREYFPRRPLVMPRLLSAMRSNNSSVKELVEIIMEDPVLTGDALRLANSPFYRTGSDPVDSIGRVIVLLGVDGLRSLIASSLMRPVFQVPRGYFEDFSETCWRQAQYAALSAQAYAREMKEGDSFTAHLLALLLHMSHIVLFRMTTASYVEASGSLPRAEVFTRLLDECAGMLAIQIARDWELPASIDGALREHAERGPLERMSPLGRCLWFGRVCGLAAIAAEQHAIEDEEVLQLLERKGMPRERAESLWRTTIAGGRG